MKRIVPVLFALLLVIFTSSCSDDSEMNSEDYGLSNAERTCYSAQSLHLDVGQECGTTGVFKIGNKVCLHTWTFTDSSRETRVSKLFLIDPNSGSQIFAFDYAREDVLSICSADENTIVASNPLGFELIDANTGNSLGEFIVEEATETSANNVASCDDGFVFVTSNEIIKYSSDGSLRKTITFSEPLYFEDDPYFYKNEHEYLKTYDSTFYELDFDRGHMNMVANPSMLRISESYLSTYGRYAYDDFNGIIYELNLEESVIVPCAYINNMLIRPSQGNSYNMKRLYVIDNDEFVWIDKYPNGVYDIQFLSQDDSLNFTDRTRLTVKGYNVTNDYVLRYAAYLYNSSQEEYFVSIEEFDPEYGYSDARSAQENTLQLIQEFSSGNAPDIFYGNNFDYDHWGASGMVIDLSPYLENTSIPCYQVYAGYRVFGLYADSSSVRLNEDNIHFFDNPSIANGLLNYYRASDIVDYAIRYSLRKQMYENGRALNEEEIEEILNIAFQYGVSEEEKFNANTFGNVTAYDVGDISLQQLDIGSLAEYILYQSAMGDELKYLGYPSIHVCAHVADPIGLVAVSASTEHPEACCEFIDYMFSYEVQESIIAHQCIPINREVFDRYIDMMSDIENINVSNPTERIIKDTMLNQRLFYRDDIRQEGYYQPTLTDINNYIEIATSVDSLNTIDWGVYNIIAEEVESYYLQNKPIPEIAEALHSRLLLYVQENY